MISHEEVLGTAQRLADHAIAVDMIDWGGWSEEEKTTVLQLACHMILDRHKKEPQRRALKLLRSWLTSEQRAEWRSSRQVTVIGSAGGRYRLYPQTGTTLRVERHGKRWWGVASFCLHPDHWIPPADIALAHLLNLRTDEPAFLARANEHKTHLWDGAYLRRLYAARRARAA